jgi:hypothetical protein
MKLDVVQLSPATVAQLCPNIYSAQHPQFISLQDDRPNFTANKNDISLSTAKW